MSPFYVALAVLLLLPTKCVAQDPIVYTGPDNVDFALPDGGLRVAVGVQNYQVLRAYRQDPAHNDGFGWTYHHSPMMQFFKGVMVSDVFQRNTVA